MDNIKALLNTISTVYAVPGNPEGWIDAVNESTHLVGGKAGVYLRINRETMITEASGFAGFTAEDVLAYNGEQAANKDIRLQYLHNLLPGKVFREFEFVTDRDAYDNSEWIRHQVAQHGVYWCLSAHVSEDAVWNDYLSINGLKARGPFSDQQKSTMELLLPHFARAAELDRIVTQLEHRFGAVLSVLDRFLVGLVVLDVKGRLLIANRAARMAGERSGAYVLDNNHFRLFNVNFRVRLAQLINEVVATICQEGNSDGGRIVVPKRSDSGGLLIEVMPIRDDGISDRDGVQGCAVFIIDPDESHILSTEGLARIFSLTEAEKAVTKEVVNGNSLNVIAEERGKSVETVRTQLKSVFQKTGASSQVELVRLAVKASPPIESKQPNKR